MRGARTRAAGAVAAWLALSGAAVLGGADTAEASHRHHYTTWRDAQSYWSPASEHPTGGWLWAGRHSFHCQTKGEPHTDGQGNRSLWWALTDDDTGGRDVYVSATAFSVAEPWEPISGLPRC